eukprot:CAMPEP_0175958154 /NCGR_PEP_ID=MMETSP0108-20121206/34094_1 /TAXON_ID=195067 ORGANISM="Goniomonas pacifica, Strain CCMP1869" /NCGR_SAMPLE_ID=MMETSP0108 /ASSEMBLY_ACC=CAM_ASM_000204 /LENGTH=149 /DNA_ID=CAMNT_0017285485 /DNA_START=144 /DNA_END=592 /DNA_ORIENTATION=-
MPPISEITQWFQDTFIERVDEVLGGETAMNCSLCKYRAQVLGFETEVGLAQASHHHHVEGLTDGCDLCELECTGACQPDGVPIPLGGGHQSQRMETTPMTTPMTMTMGITPTRMLNIPWSQSAPFVVALQIRRRTPLNHEELLRPTNSN